MVHSLKDIIIMLIVDVLLLLENFLKKYYQYNLKIKIVRNVIIRLKIMIVTKIGTILLHPWRDI